MLSIDLLLRDIPETDLRASNFMRQQAMQSTMLYGRPIPVGRAVEGIADRRFTTDPSDLN